MGGQQADQFIRALDPGRDFGWQLGTVDTPNIPAAKNLPPVTLQLLLFFGERLLQLFGRQSICILPSQIA